MADNMMENGNMKEGSGKCCSGKGGEGCGKKCCACMHHKLPTVMVLLVGVVFLAKAYGWMSASVVDIAWPIFVIVGALTKLMGGKCKCC